MPQGSPTSTGWRGVGPARPKAPRRRLGEQKRAGIRSESVLRKIALGYLTMFRDPARLGLLRIILAEGGRNPGISRIFLESGVERGSSFLGEYLWRLGFWTRDELRQASQAFFGMLFSWVVLHRILARPGPKGAGAAETREDTPLHAMSGSRSPGEAEEPGSGLGRGEAEMADRATRMFLYGLGQA